MAIDPSILLQMLQQRGRIPAYQSGAELRSLPSPAPQMPSVEPSQPLLGPVYRPEDSQTDKLAFQREQELMKQSSSNRQKTTGKEDTTSSTNVSAIAPEQLAAASEAYANLPPMEQAESQSQKLYRMIANRRAPLPETDFEPLARLSDTWYGGKLAGGAQREAADQGADAIKMQALGAKQALDLAQEARQGTYQSFLNKFLTGRKTKEELLAELKKLEQEKATDSVGTPKSEDDPKLAATKWISMYRQYNPAYPKQLDAFNKARTLANTSSEGWVKDRMKISTLVNIAGMYPISNLDVAGYKRGPGLENTFNSAIANLQEGKLFSDADRKVIDAYLKAVTKTTAEEMDNNIRDFSESNYPGFWRTPEEGYSRLAPKGGFAGKIPEEKISPKEAAFKDTLQSVKQAAQDFVNKMQGAK